VDAWYAKYPAADRPKPRMIGFPIDTDAMREPAENTLKSVKLLSSLTNVVFFIIVSLLQIVVGRMLNVTLNYDEISICSNSE